MNDTTTSPISDQLNGIFPMKKTVAVPSNRNKDITSLNLNCNIEI